MLHPVGPLPAAVYWRRRLTVLALLLAVLGGGGWLAVVLAGPSGDSTPTAAATSSSGVPTPALEQVVPSVGDVRTPGVATTAAPTAAPTSGGPCTDDALSLQVRAPATAAVGSKPTFELVVQNASAVPCARVLDKGLQEVMLFDAAGHRVWGSNDCFPEASSGTRTLAPGEVVTFPVVWGGLTSEPTCTAARVPPAPGAYVLRGRLDTKVSPDAPLTLT